MACLRIEGANRAGGRTVRGELVGHKITETFGSTSSPDDDDDAIDDDAMMMMMMTTTDS